MSISREKEALLLFFGDLFIFVASLYITLFLRYRDTVSYELFSMHLIPFGILFASWILVFFVAGLYEKHTLILKTRLPSIILKAHAINLLLAVLLFYLVPSFGIAPKTILFMYTVISSMGVVIWRVYGQELIGFGKREDAIIIGHGEEMRQIKEEINNNSRYHLTFISSIDLSKIDGLNFQEEVLKRIYSENIRVVVVDLESKEVNAILPALYNLIFSHVRFIDMHKLYEDIFDRVPLSLVKHNWFIENISLAPKATYDWLKRIMDVIIAFPLFVLSLFFYPFVYIAIKLEDGGEIFITQERVGQNNVPVRIKKFRSMTKNDNGKYEGNTQGENKVTKVGAFLRKSRIDELPQLINVLRGDISLIGPRPELPSLAKVYEKEISFYNIRHLIKPGLSGWAQIYHENHPHHAQAIEATREKLSYDLYYIRNRSFVLDVKIALKTLKTILSRSGK